MRQSRRGAGEDRGGGQVDPWARSPLARPSAGDATGWPAVGGGRSPLFDDWRLAAGTPATTDGSRRRNCVGEVTRTSSTVPDPPVPRGGICRCSLSLPRASPRRGTPPARGRQPPCTAVRNTPVCSDSGRGPLSLRSTTGHFFRRKLVAHRTPPPLLPPCHSAPRRNASMAACTRPLLLRVLDGDGHRPRLAAISPGVLTGACVRACGACDGGGGGACGGGGGGGTWAGAHQEDAADV